MPETNKNTTAILKAIAEQSLIMGRMENKLNETHNLAVKTNGRVTDLERKFERREAVDEYVKEQNARLPVQAVKVETNTQWDWKVVLAILLALATAIAGGSKIG